MDIFNRNRVAELEYKLDIVERERDRYKSDIDILTKKCEELCKLDEVIPEDCEKGPWCKACEFVRSFNLGRWNVVYACSKGKSCKNFVQKDIPNG